MAFPIGGRWLYINIGFTKSIEELFGKRRNNEAIMAILFAKLPFSEVDFDEDEARLCIRCYGETKPRKNHIAPKPIPTPH
jgi:hypothetical protein